MVAEQERVGHDDGPGSCDTMETQIRMPQKRRAVGHPNVEAGRERGRLDRVYGTRSAPPGRSDVPVAHDDEPAEKKTQKREGEGFLKKAMKLDPLVSNAPGKDKTLMLEIRGDSKTIVE